MDIYKANLTGLLGLCASLYAGQSWFVDSTASRIERKDSKTTESKTVKLQAAASTRSLDFLAVYALVMAADWLQGPFLYSLYTEEHGVAPGHVPMLFATGFVAGGVSASFVGSAADRHGRKLACLVFCAAYAASCVLTIASGSLPVLLAGRVLGGISTSLLFSVFESWMVTDFWEREKYETSPTGEFSEEAVEKKYTKEMADAASARLSHTFGRMGTVNSLAAIASGVFSEWVVAVSGTRKAPFVASAALLAAAFWLISTKWDENYGEPDEKEDGGGVMPVLSDPRVLVLGLASTLFEGSMYLFVFFWTPALKDAAQLASSSSSAPTDLPYGIIFASFMAAAMAATLTFNIVTAQLRLVRCVTLLLGLLGAAEVVFTLLSSTTALASLTEQHIFWLFCLFEGCVGTYWPCMGYLKGQVVPDGARAQVYALLRVPLNIFVVAALLLTHDGEYFKVFGVCSTLLLGAIAGVLAMVVNEPDLH
ncbi:major facilitator superfamily domain-containing protein [Ophiostoma piceae UAMH 11346]|uniref:Molybdate-anion transporter n=1 Tax=Ophiostoma piceae (strain UAMH 11346) TaxID=1262450 RepID=S3CVP0_OPHP1|nr:major facilitator superfamily domain-containing protein [Ophiostoma piceae UAMH 11346]